MDELLVAKFWSKVEVGQPNECWEWQGSFATRGYGSLWFRGKTLNAHRVSLQIAKGAIDGMMALHSCDNPACCNPKHLRWGTQSENMQDKHSRGRHYRASMHRTHCDRGHPFDESNIIHRGTAGRTCRACKVLRSRNYRLRQKAQPR